jgi:hypothetical protein
MSKAREFLRKQQETAIKQSGIASDQLGKIWFPWAPQHSDTTDLTIEALSLQQRFVETSDPEVVRRGVFRFNRRNEKERIERAEDVVRRTQPGPFEDPRYFAILAYQAASIEAAWMGRRNVFDNFVLGTIHSPVVNGSTSTTGLSGCAVVILHSALMDFLYQTAKSVVAAIDPVRSKDGASAVSADIDLKRIGASLTEESPAVRRLRETMEAYFINGYPRATVDEPVEATHSPPLQLLISLAERWVIAHEYGHALAFEGNVDFEPDPHNPFWAEEFFADQQATVTTVLSAAKLDALPPDISVSSALFAVAALDVLRRAQLLARSGREQPDDGSATHPPFVERAQGVVATLRRYFDVGPPSSTSLDLTFVVRKETPETHGFDAERARGAYAFANVLFEVWRHAKNGLAESLRQRGLHPMWRI